MIAYFGQMIEGMYFAINVQLSDSSGDQLSVLRSKVNNKYGLVHDWLFNKATKIKIAFGAGSVCQFHS